MIEDGGGIFWGGTFGPGRKEWYSRKGPGVAYDRLPGGGERFCIPIDSHKVVVQCEWKPRRGPPLGP